MLRKSGVFFVLMALAGASPRAQAGGEWVQPFPQAPGYWELVGRLFADTPQARRDRAFRGFLDPSVLAAGAIKASAREGETLANFVRFQLVQPENVLNSGAPPDRLVTADVTQVLFGVANRDSLFLEVRTGNPSSELQQCVDARHQRFGHLVDIRLQATLMCEGALFWTSWRRMEIPLADGTEQVALLDGLGRLRLAYDRATGALTGTIEAP